MRSRRSDRRTPTDLWRTKHKARSVPVVQRRERSTPDASPESNEWSDQLRFARPMPASEAINPNRQTGSQRKERSTPTVRRVSSGRSDQLQSLNGCPAGEGLITPTAGLDRGRRATSNPSFRSVLPAKDQRQLRFSSIPSWATGGERIILQSDPCNRDRAPRFLWSETLVKSQTVQSLSPFPAPQKRACKTPPADCRQIVQ